MGIPRIELSVDPPPNQLVGARRAERPSVRDGLARRDFEPRDLGVGGRREENRGERRGEE